MKFGEKIKSRIKHLKLVWERKTNLKLKECLKIKGKFFDYILVKKNKIKSGWGHGPVPTLCDAAIVYIHLDRHISSRLYQ